MEKKPIFHKAARKKVTSLIRQRQKLITMGVSRKNDAECMENISFLQRQLDTYHFADDSKMAGFLLRNKHKIFSLVPSRQQKSIDDICALVSHAYEIKSKSKTKTH